VFYENIDLMRLTPVVRSTNYSHAENRYCCEGGPSANDFVVAGFGHRVLMVLKHQTMHLDFL
jgi:hypothetical protein